MRADGLTDPSIPRDDVSAPLIGRAAGASFGELRNVLTALLGNVVLARVAAAELASRVRAEAGAARDPSPGDELLLEVPATVGEIQLALGDVELTATRLESLVVALEGLVVPGARPSSLAGQIEVASVLAHHMTKLVGGVRATVPEARVDLAGRGGAMLAALAALLSMVAARMASRAIWRGIDVDAAARAGSVVVAVRAPLPDEEIAAVARELGALLSGPALRVRPAPGVAELELDLGEPAAARVG